MIRFLLVAAGHLLLARLHGRDHRKRRLSHRLWLLCRANSPCLFPGLVATCSIASSCDQVSCNMRRHFGPSQHQPDPAGNRLADGIGPPTPSHRVTRSNKRHCGESISRAAHHRAALFLWNDQPQINVSTILSGLNSIVCRLNFGVETESWLSRLSREISLQQFWMVLSRGRQERSFTI